MTAVCMQSFVNSFPRSAEYISLYIDHKLRRSLSVASDALTDVTLNEILQIFRCDPPCISRCLRPGPLRPGRMRHDLVLDASGVVTNCAMIHYIITCV